MSALLLILAVAAINPHESTLAAGRPVARESGANGDTRGLTFPYSVQLHMHASLSEGTGAMEKHVTEAENALVDLIWWTDHDWRINYYHHVTNYGFEELTEPLWLNEPWQPRSTEEMNGTKQFAEETVTGFAEHSFEYTDAQAYAGSKSLKLSARRTQNTLRSYSHIFQTKDLRWKHSLASAPVLKFAIRPEEVSADARPFILIDLSTHPSNGTLSQRLYQIEYYLDNTITAPYRSGGVLYVPLPYTLNQWSVYTLDLLSDVAAGFPFLPNAKDNTLQYIRIGIESRNNARGTAYFDDFSMSWGAQGAELVQEQRQMLDQLESLHPYVKNYIGTEISYGFPHLTEYALDPVIHDYDQLIDLSGLADQNGVITDQPAFEDWVARYVITDAHSRGALVAWDHMFGPYTWNDTPEELIAYFLGNHAKGADIIEVGYRNREGYTLDQYKEVWDALTKNQLYLIGVGTSDSHGFGPAGHWLTDTNNFVSWIYAESMDRADILQGLRRGHVYFGDPGLFTFGSISLNTDHRFDMGDIVVTDRTEMTVNISVTGTLPGDEVRVIVDGEPWSSYSADGFFFDTQETIPIQYPLGSFLRVEIYDASGCQRSSSEQGCCSAGAPDTPFGQAFQRLYRSENTYRASQCEKAFSNPICFTPTVPPGGLPRQRVAVDMGGVFSRMISDFAVYDVTLENNGQSATLRIVGNADNGGIQLDFSQVAPCMPSVQFNGLDGTFDFADSLLTITGINGDGDVAVSWAVGPDCNNNGIADSCEIDSGSAIDCNGDGIPDECETVPDLQITQQPTDAVACDGDSVAFSVAAVGTAPLDIQWRKDGNPIDGAIGASYMIAAVTAADAGSYDAVATNPCGTLTSDPAQLAVQAAPLAGAGADQSICSGADASLTGNASTFAAVEWTSAGDGSFADPSTLNTTYTPGPSDLTAGSVVLTLTAHPLAPCAADATDSLLVSIDAAPTINADPQSLTIQLGADAVFSIDAQGTGPLTYQWRLAGVDLTDDARITGATTATLTISPTQAEDAGSYTCLVSGPCGMLESGAAELSLTTPGCPHPQTPCEISDIYPPDMGDCVVDLGDLGVVLANFAPGVPGKTRAQGDVWPLGGGDGIVNISDLGQVITDFAADCR